MDGHLHFGPRWSSMTRTFLEDNNAASIGTLPLFLWLIALRDIGLWRNVNVVLADRTLYVRANATVLRPVVVVVVCDVMYCD